MRSFSMVFSFTILFFLLGCEEKQDIHHGEAGFITQFVSKDQVLIGNVIYSITGDTKISSSSGESLDKSDLQLGMKIQPYYNGSMAESFPAKAEARLLRVMTDDESMRESVMLINVLQQLKRSEEEHFIVTEVERQENAYIMYIMKRSNVDIGFTLTVDAETYEILRMEA
ncbi:hypothetical protein IEO70_14610 [Bacillus sp. AGMB 02131]|uniref:DUF3221 domain-containing protein n=1 Tax=Peribacillus faecalis TaxID=2772559 RepID=A0A927CXK6_9BACI|nr:hypothetical protein [Peribacillus faecalis]MBD3109577.1 hypothetical protein [Peribacillus faecalis]